MTRSIRANRNNSSDIWPGFVDALSTLLLAVIFLLVVFVLSQFLLSELLQGRDAELRNLRATLQTTEAQIEAERQRAAENAAAAADNAVLRADLTALRDELAARVAERDALTSERQALLARLATTQEDLRELATDLDASERTVTIREEELAALRADLRLTQEIREQLRADLDARERRLAELETEIAQLRARLAERDAAQEDLLAEQDDLQSVNRASVAEIARLRAQLSGLRQDLATADQERQSQALTIEGLEIELTAALADRVQELERFRSDFFGQIREVIGENDNITIEGDRFVVQSEVLFGSGEADLDPGGLEELRQLAATLREVTARVPDDLPWVLRVDGHTDVRPINTPRFPSNWELSAARAISVARFLRGEGIPAERLAATGFAEFQPIDTGESAEALRRNRRIEIKLTTR